MSASRERVLNQPLAFVDIETNGLNAVRGRVIEVAAIRVEEGRIASKFSSLVDPGTELPQFITNLTGITSGDVRGAPPFRQIAPDLRAVLDGAIFVAHNVRFDYSFLKQEFKRLHEPFLPKQLCTVRLSRALHPEARGHKLADLIARHNLQYDLRHRAYDDALVLWQFWQYVIANFPADQIESAALRQIRRPSLPQHVRQGDVDDLPEGPGVYVFEDDAGQPLYVGKSVHIRQRVLSHFGRDHADSKEFKIAQATHRIRTERAPGELSALLLESQLVKDLQPVLNRKLRRLSSMLLVTRSTDAAGYVGASLEDAPRVDPDCADGVLAVYPNRARAKIALGEIAKTFDLCPKLLGLEKTKGACFSYQLHRCRGACVGKERPEVYNQRVLAAFEHQRIHGWPYKGPVLLEEQGQSEYHAFVVDKWCILGEVTQEPHCEPVVKVRDRVFDLDTYKILQAYLSAKLHNLVVKQLDMQQLAQLDLGF